MTEQCVICLENMDDKQTLLLLECTHIYHKECIDDWLNKSQTCPMCRENIDKDIDKNIDKDNTVECFINRYLCKLYFMQYIAIVDLVTSGIIILIDQHGLLFFAGAFWGFWGAFRLNSMCLIIYGLSRILTISMIGYKVGMYIKDDITRIYDANTILYCIVCTFYIYLGYIIYVLIRDMRKYKENISLLIN